MKNKYYLPKISIVKQLSNKILLPFCTMLGRVSIPSASKEENVVTITCATTGATIKYSTNGGESYNTYSTPITITETTTFKIYATKSNFDDSFETTFIAEYETTVPLYLIDSVIENNGDQYVFETAIAAKYEGLTDNPVSYIMLNFNPVFTEESPTETIEITETEIQQYNLPSFYLGGKILQYVKNISNEYVQEENLGGAIIDENELEFNVRLE